MTHDAQQHRSDEFTQTQWTQIALAAMEDGSEVARQALERLCTRYWPALYGYLRRQGRLPAEAEDLTQAFIAELLTTKAFSRADRSKGRFRNFLLGSLRRFVADEQRRNGAEKRGRNKVVLALDFGEVERQYLEEAEPALGPDEVFDRRWAATVLEAAFAELETEFARDGKAARFAELNRFLSEPGTESDYAALAGRLGISPQSVPAVVCRFRERYRELVRRTVLLRWRMWRRSIRSSRSCSVKEGERMKAAPLCPRCGARLPTTALGGLCPRCVGRGLLGAEPAVQVPVSDEKANVAEGASESLSSGDDLKLSLDDLEPRGEMLGQKIGRYKVLELIGEGGCGVVYVAEQTEPVRRRVALKVIKLGMDTKRVIARFEAERQALALMDHPNIARVLDAGATDTGRPYFVMELVRGIKITKYCDEQKLPMQRRLDLFIQVCQAVQHAHQKGIIHRDLKPSNILVTERDAVPAPKVIDFGIAKATGDLQLTDKTLFTAFEQFIGTPAYMSPEQARLGELDIDTRSDIYSLGVLLYELLTGKTPFETKALLAAGLDELRRTILEDQPAKPSTRLSAVTRAELTTAAHCRATAPLTLLNALRGDLDWIVMKCLEKDRARRYETANALAMDVRRHLAHEPVLARPASRLYEFQKTVRRHRLGFAAAAAITAALGVGVTVSTLEAVRARRAESEQARMRKETDVLRLNEITLRSQAETKTRILQATLLFDEGKPDEADRLANQLAGSIPPASPEGAVLFRTLGQWHAASTRWPEAAARFGELFKVNQLDSRDQCTLDYLKRAVLLVETHDATAYDRLRHDILGRFADERNPAHAERLVKGSLLLPVSDELIRALRPLADLEENSDFLSEGDNRLPAAGWAAVSVAIMKYRQADYAAAHDWCNRCLAFPPGSEVRTATARIILAMASCHLHKDAEAVSEFARGRDVVDGKFKAGLGPEEAWRGQWFDWLTARVFLREAQLVIGEALPSGGDAGDPHLVDLSAFYNAGFKGNWHGDRQDNDLSELPTGIQNLAGIAFDVRALIQIGNGKDDVVVLRGRDGPEMKRFPDDVNGLPVKGKLHRIHFLHGAIWGFDPPGTVIAKYVIHYADGTVDLKTLALGKDLQDWWTRPPELPSGQGLQVAWSGKNGNSREQGITIQLYKTTWENPRPDSEIVSLDLISAKSKTAPFLVAITVE